MLIELIMFLWALPWYKLLLLTIVSTFVLIVKLWPLWAFIIVVFYIGPEIGYRSRMYMLERRLQKRTDLHRKER